jgi:cytochrome c2
MKQRRKLLLALFVFAITAWLIIAPPRFWLNLIKPVDLSDPVRTGTRLTDEYDCLQCHRIAGRGSLTGPDLKDITKRLDKTSITLWLQNPQQIKSNTAMPNLRLSDSEIEAILAYLYSVSP